MSQISRSVQTVRRHKRLVGAVAGVGLLAGAVYSLISPPLLSSTALVILPSSAPSVATQVVIADSEPVLSAALPKVASAVSVMQLRRELKIKSITNYLISVTATDKTGAEAEQTANAVANSYMAYVTPRYTSGHVLARMLASATVATGTGLVTALAIKALLGALLGVVVGITLALIISRKDRRLRERDDIANSIGIPILASVPVGHPVDASGWTWLLDDYKPQPVDAWQLRTALQQLGMADHALSDLDGGGFSVSVLSFTADLKALALGPQLAVFAASHGIETKLVLGPQQNPSVTAALRVACVTPPQAASKRSGLLRVTVSDDGSMDQVPDGALTIAVMVVDAEEPKIPDGMRTMATVIGVSAAAATADQLARVAVTAAAYGREISGILVADPEPTDRTSGRIPRPVQSARHRQTRPKVIATEIRR